jgi:photosynthetic reaction center H subunit
MSPALTANIDVAQIVLYAFWIFFFGLIFWIRREDRREGYPLESDNPRNISNIGPILLPKKKTFILPEGGTYDAPNYVRDERAFAIQRSAPSAGAPSMPVGDPLLSEVGPASWCARHDIVEETRDGRDCVIPMRVATEFRHFGGADPRGWDVLAADQQVVGKVSDMWVDRADVCVRYLEVELEGGEVRLVPMPMSVVRNEAKQLEVEALESHQFTHVPTTKEADRITMLEEEKISAFFAGARMYANDKRMGPLV